MDWLNEMGEMVAIDAPERETYYEQMIDAQVREIVEACACETAGSNQAVAAILNGFCDTCGWDGSEMAYACRGCGAAVARANASCGCPMA